MIIQGDCIEKLKELEDNSVDAVITDPPYELGFMGKKWDASGIAYNVELWQEALRVLKPPCKCILTMLLAVVLPAILFFKCLDRPLSVVVSIV